MFYVFFVVTQIFPPSGAIHIITQLALKSFKRVFKVRHPVSVVRAKPQGPG